jgi:energy-coupling factor transport system substrate-specific component
MKLKSGLLLIRGESPPFLLSAAAAVGLSFFNAGLHFINLSWIGLPLFLDMIGTFISTLFFGLAPGLITAIATHGFIELLQGFPLESITWVQNSILSALLFWILIRRELFKNLLHAVLASVYITLLNAVLGAITATFLYSGLTGHPVDNLVTGFLSIGNTLISATFWGRIPINLMDKGLAVFIAFGLMKLYTRRQTEGPEL